MRQGGWSDDGHLVVPSGGTLALVEDCAVGGFEGYNDDRSVLSRTDGEGVRITSPRYDGVTYFSIVCSLNDYSMLFCHCKRGK